MQPPGWYVKRLRSMSAGEVAWRIGSLLRDVLDRPRFALGRVPDRPFPMPGDGDPPSAAPGFRVTHVPVGAWSRTDPGDPRRRFADSLDRRAGALCRNRLSFFDLEDRFLGDPPLWNRDHGNGIDSPMGFAPAIDYRDFRVTGDAKLVWEPNRHHQLVVLARAYRATGKGEYARAVARTLLSWLEQCPFGRGMNWRSPLELAIRLINWVWAYDMVRESGFVDAELRRRIASSVRLHVWEIARKYSKGSSANNHVIGEAAGVFVAASYFRDLPGAEALRSEARAILSGQIVRQTFPDGANRELALGYHLFVFQFFLVAAVAARKCGDDFPAPYPEILSRMAEFAAALSEGGPPPMYGDSDDGYVLDLGQGRGSFDGWLSAGALFLRSPGLKALAGGMSEEGWWLFGEEGRGAFDSIPLRPRGPLASRSFPDSGIHILQWEGTGCGDGLSVHFDTGELGYGAIAAHGHADALSVTLRAGGEEILVDPGTYDYFTHREWRDYFRSTRGHNTVAVDGVDQSVMEGPFLWGERARGRRLDWLPDGGGGTVSGEHDGYRRLADPVDHRRTVSLAGPEGELRLRDRLASSGSHEAAFSFHFSPRCVLEGVDGTAVTFRTEGGRKVVLRLDPSLEISVRAGEEGPDGGWCSDGYHRKRAAAVVTGKRFFRGTVEVETILCVGKDRGAGHGGKGGRREGESGAA
jgi:hypothetical protein